MGTRLISLDDPRAVDSDLVGVKAAWLARARRVRLAVLPGLVVPADAAIATLEAGQRALDGSGPGLARSAALAAPVDPALWADLDGLRALGERLVVRSSSHLDDDGVWAGAFASYGEVSPDELERAVKGCWASAFAPHTLARFERASRRPGDVRIGVLIQPHLRMDHGGWARILDDRLEVASVAGHPGPLLSGQVRGRRALVALREPDQAVPALDGLPAAAVASLRRLALSARDELGADRVEWGFADGQLMLLQLASVATIDVRPELIADADDGRFRGDGHMALARLLAGRRGPLADRILTPWAAVIPRSEARSRSRDGHGTSDDAASLLRMAQRLNEAAADAAGLSVEELRDALAAGEDPPIERPVAPTLSDASARTLANVEHLAAALVEHGALPSVDALWWQDEAWLVEATEASGVSGARRVASLAPARARPLSDRWDALRFGVASAAGTLHTGLPAASGRGAGRARWVTGPDDAADLHAGDVLVVEHPVPALAPLLWDRGGVIAASGSPASHLCEVARSVHVPMVVGVDLPHRPGAIVALDGDTGTAWAWQP